MGDAELTRCQARQFPCDTCGKMIWSGWCRIGVAGMPPNPVNCGACCAPPRAEMAAHNASVAWACDCGCGGVNRCRADDANDALSAHDKVELLTEVRLDERRQVGRMLGEEANRIFNHQTIKDYPGNVLDRINMHLVAGEPLEVRPEKYSRCRGQVKCCGCLDCLPAAQVSCVEVPRSLVERVQVFLRDGIKSRTSMDLEYELRVLLDAAQSKGGAT